MDQQDDVDDFERNAQPRHQNTGHQDNGPICKTTTTELRGDEQALAAASVTRCVCVWKKPSPKQRQVGTN